MGRDVAIPSGILCIAIATAIAIPSLGSRSADVKVAMPSGKLCIAIARAVIMPMRFKLSFRDASGFITAPISLSVDGRKKSIIPMIKMPAKNAVTQSQ